MTITEKDITAAVARKLREEAGLPQTAFWEPLGVKQSVGCRYENDIPVPKSVRILLVARYVSGVQIDAATQDGVAELKKLGSIQAKHTQAKAIAKTIATDLAKAAKSLQVAQDALSNI